MARSIFHLSSLYKYTSIITHNVGSQALVRLLHYVYAQLGLKHPRIGVAVMVIKSGRVLLGKRKGAHGAGTWALPGGHLHFGESIEASAQREVMEETGLSIADVKAGPYTNDIFTQEDKHYVTLYLVARYAGGRLQAMEPDKCESWDWFDWDHLPQPRFLSLENLLRMRFDPVAWLDS